MKTHDHITRWIRLVLATAMAMAVGLAIVPGTSPQVASAANNLGTQTAFEIDGDIDLDGVLGPQSAGDWGSPLNTTAFYGPGLTPGSLPTSGILGSTIAIDVDETDPTDSPCDGSDVSGIPGSQTIDTNPYVFGPENVNNKVDFCAAGAAFELVQVAPSQFEFIYYSFWARSADATGDISVFQQLEGPEPGRCDDILIEFDYDPSGGGTIDFDVQGWTPQANDDCANPNGAGSWSGNPIDIPDTNIDAAVGPNDFIGAGTDSPGDETFGELAINLTGLGILPSDRCASFTSGGLISKTGESDNSQIKDIIRFDSPLTIDNCGDLSVVKQTNPADIPGGPFGYVVYQLDGLTVHDQQLTGGDPADGEPDPTTSSIGANLTVPTDASDDWQNVIASPDYQIDEVALPSGWSNDNIECSYFDVFAGERVTETVNDGSDPDGASDITGQFIVVPTSIGDLLGVDVSATCVITNSTSAVVVAKTGDGDDEVPFDFAITNNPEFQLALDQSSGSYAFTPGSSVTITETLPATTPAWTLDSIECIGDVSGAVTPTGETADSITFVTLPGETITCTFDNSQASRILVEKVGQPDPDTANTEFGFETDIDAETEAPADFTLQIGDTVANGTNYDSFDVAPGTYTVTELIGDAVADPAFELFNVNCVDDLTGSNASISSPITDGASVAVAAGDVVTCTFDNRQLGRIIVDKTVDVPASGDTVAVGSTFDFTGDITTTLDAIEDNGDELPGVDVVAGPHTVSESSAPGYTLDSIVCSDAADTSGASSGDTGARTANFDVSPGEVVECTFTNLRNSAQFIVAKEWVDAIADDTVTLAADGSDVNAEEIAGVQAVAPNSNQDSMTVYSGEIVDFSETFGPGVEANYIVTLLCEDADGEIINNSGATSGQLVVPDDPTDITCTFTNTRRSTSLLLQKEWVDGRTDDTAALTAGTASATSTAAGTAGSEIDDSNQAVLTTIFVGDSVDLSEVLSADELYTTELTCVGGDLTYTSGDLSGTVEVLIEDEGEQIVCTFTNTRKTVTVEVTKDWADSPSSDDALDLEIGPDGAELGTGSSAVAGTTTNASAEVLVGETYDIREVFTTGDAANYDIDWSCNNDAADVGSGTSGSVAVAGTDDDVLCTFVNDRLSTTLTLAKAWKNGAPTDTSELTVTPELTTATGPVVAGVPAGGNGAGTASVDAVTVYAGEGVTLSEAFGAGNVGTYDVTDFSCVDSVNAAIGWTGATDLNAVLTIAPTDTSAITCTVTNARRSATLTLVKTWDDPVGGIDLSIDAAGDDANVGETISEATTSPAGTSGGMTIFSGETISLSETFTADATDLDLFTSTLDCGAGELGLTENPDGTWTTTIDAGTDPVDTTCTFDNVRKSTTLELYKSWVNGTPTDAYELTIVGTDSPNVVTDDAIAAEAPDGSGQSADFAALLVYAGETVDLSEAAAAGNVGTYTVAATDGLVCSAGTVTHTALAESGSVTIAAGDVATDPIVCEFTNERTSAELTLRKSWVNGAADDTADLGITSVLASEPADGATSTVSGDPGTITTETDTTNVVTATVLSGEVVTVDELLGAGNVGTYTSSLSCDQPVLTVDPVDGTTGDFTVAADPADTTCTFTNTRTSVTLVVEKEWVDGEADDTAEITVTSDLGGGVATSTSTGQAGSEVDTPVVTATVLSGEAVIIAEELGAGNLATYASSLDCGTGVIGSTSGQITVPSPTEGDITCRFLNEAGRGNITIVKSVNGADGTFDFNGDWVDPDTGLPVGDFQLLTEGGTVSQTWTGVIVPSDGSPFTVTETDPGAAYDFTSLVCAESGANADNGSTSDGLVGSIDLDVGESVVCTYTNTQRSTLIVVKDAVPDDDQDFAFATTESGPIDQLDDAFTLDDDAGFAASPDPDTLDNTFTSELLSAGDAFTYSVAETPVAGWVNTSATCDNGNTPDAITLAPGTTVTCTFVNDADEGSVAVTKTVEGVSPDYAWSFDIAIDPVDVGVTSPQTISGVGDGTGDSPAVFEPLTLNQTYTILEPTIPAGWTQTFVGCSVPDADDATDGYQVTITEPNQAITCDITNTATPPTLVVEKTTVGGEGVFTFDVAPTDAAYPVGPLTADTAIGSPNSTATVDLQAGVGYTVTEQDEIGWIEGALTCTVTPADGSGAVPYVADAITQPGDVISCEITNTRQARIIVKKTTVPAAAAGDFGFEASWNGPADTVADFTLADGDSENSGFIDPNVQYTITELDAQGFELTGVVCNPAGIGSVANSNAVVAPAPGAVITCDFTNTQRGEVTVQKDAVTAITRVGTTYSVTYDITVGNTSYTDELFTLTDSPDMADNVTITSMVVNGPGVTDLDIAPDGGTIVTDETVPARAGQGGIGEPDALVYTVVTEFTMTPSNVAQDCNGSADNGAYNGATVTFVQPPTTNSDDDCVDLPTPNIDVEKVADAPVAVQIGDTFQYQADYTVTVTNSGEGPGSYTLADLPDFGSGAVDSVEIAPQPDAVSNVIEAGGEVPYSVTVLFTVAGDLPAVDRECGETPTPGQGGYNSVTVTYGPTPDPSDDACVEIPDPDIEVTKVATTDTATLVFGNTYQAVYTVTVDNVGDGPGSYSLVDLPDFGAGANILTTTIVPEPVSPTAIEAGGQDVYTVTVDFTVDGDMPVDERECGDDPTAGQGGYNGVTVNWNEGQTSTDDDCVDIPGPNVDYDKIVVGDAALYNGDNQWTVTYQIDVTNLDPAVDEAVGPAQYDLTDTFDFGPDVTVDGVVVTTNPDTLAVIAGFDGDAQNALADDTLINRNETHTYTIEVDVTIVPTQASNGDCTNGGGLANSAGISVATDPDEAQRLNQEACASYSTLTLIKELINDDGGNAEIEQFVLTADLGDTEILSGHTLVSESVPAGDYALAETQVAGYASDGFTCGAAAMNGQTVAVPLGANVSCTIVNDDEPVDLELTKDDGGAEAVAGGAPFDYTISVQNIGTRDVDAGEPVTVTDTLPSGLVWVSFPANCSQGPAQVLTCDIPPASLPAGGDPVVITATVRAPAGTASGTYVNKASVTTEDDPTSNPPCPATSDNNVDCEATPVDRQGAVQIIKTDDVADGDFVEPGDTFTYQLVVRNTGVSTLLPGTHVEDDLPAQLEFVSASGGTGWTCNNADPVDCDYGPILAPGQTAPPITVTVKVAAGASGDNIENVAVVLAAVDRNCPSATARLVESFAPACNQVTDDDDETTPLTANADLAIVKTASVPQVGAGGGFDWTLDITNNGPGTAVNVVIGDLVPSLLDVTGVASSDFDCDNSGNDVECTIGSLAVGASGTVTISVTVPSTTAGGDVTNIGTVESDTPDPDLTNNSDDATVIIVAIAPPTTTLPPVTLPRTGSDATQDIVRIAMVFLLLGGSVVLITRRRRDHGIPVD